MLDWDKDDRLHGIALFAYLTIQMQNLMSSKEAILVVNKPETTYIKTCRGRGRPKKTDQIAKTNSTINQFFALAQASTKT